MRILIASTVAPFINGGGRFIVDWLEQKLHEFGYTVDVLRLPFLLHWQTLAQQTLALRLLNISDHADRLITIRTPSYVIKHPNKIIWFIHHYRGFYDYWGTQYQDVPSNTEGLSYRNMVYQADMQAFTEARAIYTNSQVVSNRLQKFNNIPSNVLYPPLLNPEQFYCHEYGDYILYMSRLTHHKRQHLVLESFAKTKSQVKLVLAGCFENQSYKSDILELIDRYNLKNRVMIIDRWIDESEKASLMASCLATVYCPLEEDSYGYSSLEAHHSKKSVITTVDSGGTLELITDGENGFVIKDDIQKGLADAFDTLYANRNLAKRMGENGFDKLQKLNTNWTSVISKLTA